MLKISLFYDGFGLKREITMGHLISVKCSYQCRSFIFNLQKTSWKAFFVHIQLTSLKKIKSIHSVLWSLAQNIINITFLIHMSCKIWIFFEIVGKKLSKDGFQMVFFKLEKELLQVDVAIYHLEICLKLVRYQMPHCFFCSKSKTNLNKWYFNHFIDKS